MLLEDLKSLKTGRRELRNFGLLVGGVFLAIGLWALLKHKAWYLWALWPGSALMLFGVVAPAVLKPIYIVWMSLALVMGFVVSHVLLTVFFFLVITPIGLVARLAGRDFLRLKRTPGADTYWIQRPKREPGRQHFERQF